MKHILSLLLAMVLISSPALAQQTINDPNAEIRAAKGFHAIEVSNAFDVYLTQGNEEGVAVSTTDQRYKENIQVEVKGGVLVIRYTHKGKWVNQKLKAYISFKNLDRLTISGACDVYVLGTWKQDNVKIDLSGAANLKGKVDLGKVKVNLSGASDMNLTGAAGTLAVEASGASNFKGYELSSDFCNVNASGASDVKITVNKEFTAEASGASDIRYRGNAEVREIRSSGASSVRRKDG
ncbi:head GIN domain-containing protein [Terrimonas ferruginea]|uniref:head GIN domain-containing protein n=1 Tax=Terrimonas ferruginea TaxID=249 RepID=UPI0003F7C3E8|nr:head GIN domain-containing protein [Terrimonas ferruginea]